MSPLRILVVGCGRSGTAYTARLLGHLGLDTKHEVVFNHDLDPVALPSCSDITARWDRYGGEVESSWLAAPFLTRLPPHTIVWHQMRDPVKVVRCWATHDILGSDNAAAKFVLNALPECRTGTRFERALTYVIRWTALIEATCHKTEHWRRYKIEDLTASLLHDLLTASGRPRAIAQIEDAMQLCPPGTGGCFPYRHADLPNDEPDHVAELDWFCQRYGYPASDISRAPWN